MPSRPDLGDASSLLLLNIVHFEVLRHHTSGYGVVEALVGHEGLLGELIIDLGESLERRLRTCKLANRSREGQVELQLTLQYFIRPCLETQEAASSLKKPDLSAKRRKRSLISGFAVALILYVLSIPSTAVLEKGL